MRLEIIKKKVLVSGVLAFLLVAIVACDNNKSNIYGDEKDICNEAIAFGIKGESGFTESISVTTKGKGSCSILVFFSNNENLINFNKERVARGDNPEYINYKERKIEIITGLSDINALR